MVSADGAPRRSRYPNGAKRTGDDAKAIYAEPRENSLNMETFSPEMRDLLIMRLETRANQERLAGVYQIADTKDVVRHFTPQQIVEEVRRGTPAGEEFLFAEKKLMDELKRRM